MFNKFEVFKNAVKRVNCTRLSWLLRDAQFRDKLLKYFWNLGQLLWQWQIKKKITVSVGRGQYNVTQITVLKTLITVVIWKIINKIRREEEREKRQKRGLMLFQIQFEPFTLNA